MTALDRARRRVDAWLAAASPASPASLGNTPSRESADDERWLLDVPDIGVTCEVLLADRLLRDLRADERRRMHRFIRACQHPSGAWLNTAGQPDLSLTAMGWWACVECGDDPRDEFLVRARRVVHGFGGAQRANFSVRLWLALAGHIPWAWLPSMPAELWILPAWAVVSPSRIAPWARGLMTPLLLLTQSKARLHLAPGADELLLRRPRPGDVRGEPIPPRLFRPGLTGDLLQAADNAMKVAKKIPRGPVRAIALGRARAWITQTQQRHGGWFSTRPTLLALVALRVMGAPFDDARITRGLAYLRRARGLVAAHGGREEPALAQGLTTPPLSVVAGLVRHSADPGARERFVRRLIAFELREPGEWQRRTNAPAGGWPHEQDANHYLDIKSTCAALDVLHDAVTPDSPMAPQIWSAIRRASEVVLAMQEPDGSFARFERGESDVWMTRLPWRDANILAAGHRHDRERVQMTATVLHTLAQLGLRADDDRIARGLRWLEQRCTSSVPTSNGRRDSLSDLDILTLGDLALASAALHPAGHPTRRAIEDTIRARQREDGSFGGTVATAVSARGLIALHGGPCIQSERAIRLLTRTLQDQDQPEPAAHPVTGREPPPPIGDEHVAVPGLGLCPRCQGPSLATQAVAAALAAHRGGRRAPPGGRT